MSANEQARRIAAALALSAVAMVGASGASAAAPLAHAAKTCTPLPHYPGVGYFTSLTVTDASCTTGEDVALAYYHCRLAHGGIKGHCPGGVLGFKCSESPRESIPTEFDARVTCTKGHEKVVHTYQQDT